MQLAKDYLRERISWEAINHLKTKLNETEITQFTNELRLHILKSFIHDDGSLKMADEVVNELVTIQPYFYANIFLNSSLSSDISKKLLLDTKEAIHLFVTTLSHAIYKEVPFYYVAKQEGSSIESVSNDNIDSCWEEFRDVIGDVSIIFSLSHQEMIPFTFFIPNEEKSEIRYYAHYRNPKLIVVKWVEEGKVEEVFYSPNEVEIAFLLGDWVLDKMNENMGNNSSINYHYVEEVKI